MAKITNEITNNINHSICDRTPLTLASKSSRTSSKSWPKTRTTKMKHISLVYRGRCWWIYG